MKKFGMIVLAAALAFAMVGTAVAADVGGGFSAGVNLYTKGRMYQLDLAGDLDAEMYVLSQGRFSFGYAADDYKAVLQLEVGETDWDSTAEDAVAVEVKHLYVTGPLGPVGLTVGLQPLKLGNSIVYNDDDFAIKAVYAIPTGGALVFGYVKETEGFRTSDPADDVTGIVVIYSNEVSGWKIDPFLAYGLLDEGAGDGNMIWLGVPVSGVAGPVSIAAELDYATGSVFDTDVGGLALWAKGTYPLAQANAFLELGYGSGDDPGTADYEGFSDFANYFIYDLVLEELIIKNDLEDKLYIKIGGDYQQSEQLTLSGAFIYNMALQEDNWGGETALGTELDLAAAYKLNASTTLGAEFGYLIPGDALGPDSEAVYAFEWNLTYNF